MSPFPRIRPVAERALLVEFGEAIDEAIHADVLRLDAALARTPFPGFTEAVPAYASLLVGFDPILTDHAAAEAATRTLLRDAPARPESEGRSEIEVCYDGGDLAPDLPAVAEAAGLTPDEVMAAHLSGNYRVFMYGFAPGYAYLGGVPEPIRLPRKATAVRGVAAGSVIVAGPQCLVTTIEAPTGWWVIGRSPTPVFDPTRENPFLLEVGERVRFQRIGRDALFRAGNGRA